VEKNADEEQIEQNTAIFSWNLWSNTSNSCIVEVEGLQFLHEESYMYGIVGKNPGLIKHKVIKTDTKAKLPFQLTICGGSVMITSNSQSSKILESNKLLHFHTAIVFRTMKDLSSLGEISQNTVKSNLY